MSTDYYMVCGSCEKMQYLVSRTATGTAAEHAACTLDFIARHRGHTITVHDEHADIVAEILHKEFSTRSGDKQ